VAPAARPHQLSRERPRRGGVLSRRDAPLGVLEMNSIIYLVGLIVVVLAILGFLGLH
jgi:hypothetical protein